MRTHFLDRYRWLLLLAFFFVISRVIFASSSPYVWDSVNFALGLKNFSIADGQPHFPGYLFYMLIAKTLHLILQNPFKAIVAVNLLFGLITFWLLYKLGKLTGSSRSGFVACILFVFNPLAWFYGEVAEIYMAEAALSAGFGFLSLKFALAPRHRSFLPASFLLGLVGGFRLNLEIFLFPLWIYILFFRKGREGTVLTSAIAWGAGNLLWVVPTLIHVGGIQSYLALSDATVGPFLRSSSIFFGGDVFSHAKMAARTLAWIAIFFGPVLAVSLLIVGRGRRLLRGEKPFLFFLLWAAPALSFFLLFYIAKPGYLLIFLPPLFTLAGSLLSVMFSKNGPLAAALILLCLPGMVYLFSPGVKQDEMRLRLGEGGAAKSKIRRLFRYTLADVKHSDEKNALYFGQLTKTLRREANPIFVFSNYSDWSFRIAQYYFPDVPSHLLSFSPDFKFTNHDVYESGKSHEVSDSFVDVSRKAVYLFVSPFSPQRRGLIGTGYTNIPHLDDCLYFPGAGLSGVHFEGDSVWISR